jgi:dihydrofolate reductase
MTVPVAIIAAVSENGVIGNANTIPWRLPSDFAWFKRKTLGKPLIMGRKTFESIGRPLPGRATIVVTRQRGYQPDGVLVIDSLGAALEHAQAIAAADQATEVMVAGGGEIYRQTMPLAHRLYITHVRAAPQGDTQFPAIDPAEWQVTDEPSPDRRAGDSADYHVKVYARREPALR